MDAVLKVLADNEGLYLRELAEFVGIPSVSTDPAHRADVWRAAEWVAERLRKAGPIEVEILGDTAPPRRLRTLERRARRSDSPNLRPHGCAAS